MRRISLLMVTLIASPTGVQGEPARFWLSTSNVDPYASAQNMDLVKDSIRYLHIWVTPGISQQSSDMPPIPPSVTLQSISLNVVTATQGLELQFPSNRVYNPMLDSQISRYQYVAVGHNLNGSACQSSDNTGRSGICTLGGTSFPESLPGLTPAAGIGPTCHANDPYCVNMQDGTPAWLIASVAVSTSQVSGSNDLFLQIGPDGMNHAGHSSRDTSVVFDATASTPEYWANRNDHRNKVLGNDGPDAVLTAVPQSAVSIRNFSGESGNWRDVFYPNPGTAPTWTDHVVIGTESMGKVVTIDDSQQAYHTNVEGGRLHFDMDASLASNVKVGPEGTISGSGWIGGDLDLSPDPDLPSGTLYTDLNAPLNVLGVADLDKAKLQLPGSYTPNSGDVTDPITIPILTASHIIGSFDFAPHDFGDGIYLDSIQYTPASVSIERYTPATVSLVLRREETPPLPGDFDDDGDIDGRDFLAWQRGESPAPLSAADLAQWQAAYPRLGDFDGDGDVDGRDFLAWQRGQSPYPLSASDLAIWQDQYPPRPGDFDGDGDVDGRDFLVWQRGGSPTPLSSADLAEWQVGYGEPLLASVTVPEPAASFLQLVCAVSILYSWPLRLASR